MYTKTTTQVKEIPYCDPISIFKHLHYQPWAIFLDSALTHQHYGRFSYIAIDPFRVLWAKNGQIKLDDNPLNSSENPFTLLKAMLMEMRLPNSPHLPPFQGGAAGAFAYDLYQYLENIPAHQTDDMHFPDMALGFYDVVISFDHFQEKAWIISTGLPEITAEAKLSRAVSRLNDIDALIQQCTFSQTIPITSFHPEPITNHFTPTTYMKVVQRVIEYILSGDIFQANISQRLTSQLPANLSPFDLYEQLRKINPAPFAAFMNLNSTFVVSASPERFLQLNNHQVESRPIKGTRPRSEEPLIDQQLADQLINSSKDRAENIMIVDLVRNDLSKVCKNHTVQVKQLCMLETYATVHHLVSVICGELHPNLDAVDLLMATFPGGSITGAPKIRAMEIIAEIEPTKRGLYCGSVGYIGFNDTMDTSIAIRTYTIKDDKITFQAGGAIVANSDPDDEYQETLTKLAALKEALGVLS